MNRRQIKKILLQDTGTKGYNLHIYLQAKEFNQWINEMVNYIDKTTSSS